MKSEKSTHNSVVEASLYRNDCLFQKRAMNFALLIEQMKILRTIMLSNIATVTK